MVTGTSIRNEDVFIVQSGSNRFYLCLSCLPR
jgi:hypothetical protein